MRSPPATEVELTPAELDRQAAQPRDTKKAQKLLFPKQSPGTVDGSPSSWQTAAPLPPKSW